MVTESYCMTTKPCARRADAATATLMPRPPERLWLRLKKQVLERRERPFFADLAAAQTSVADYFDSHNHEYPHSSIGYRAPCYTHQQFLQTNALDGTTYLDRLKCSVARSTCEEWPRSRKAGRMVTLSSPIARQGRPSNRRPHSTKW